LKPGGHLVAFSGTRTYHNMASAIEQAGFEIRDQLAWVYGSGFPKSHDVSKGIDKAAGAVRTERTGIKPGHENFVGRDNVKSLRESGVLSGEGGYTRPWMHDPEKVEAAHHTFAPATDAAREWQGWGTALKPSWEPICLARKPLIGTVAANVLEHGTGAINVDGCRVGEREEQQVTGAKKTSNTYGAIDVPGGKILPPGRWPANIIHDGSDEVVGAFPSVDGAVGMTQHGSGTNSVYGTFERNALSVGGNGTRDSGSAARFFYSAKADDYDRVGSRHPTVKPVDLMQWLVRLVTPKGGLVLDPFAGTGTTGEAAYREGMSAILIEREEEYQDDIRRRMRLVLAGPEERARESLKASGKTEGAETLPLFQN
jgi:hypothetical protein